MDTSLDFQKAKETAKPLAGLIVVNIDSIRKKIHIETKLA